MANKVFVDLGFNFNGSGVTSAVGGIGKITGSIKGMDSALGSVAKTLKSLKNAASLMLAVQGTKSIFGGISSIGKTIKDGLKREFDFVADFASAGDKIAKTSRLVGLSVKDYQAFSSAAKHSGMYVEEMDSALKKFNVELGKAKSGDKNALKMFDAILGGKKLSGFKDSMEILKEIANGYTKLASAEQKAFVTQSLFGRGGAQMSELLSGGGKGIEKAIADFENTGGGFTEEGTKNAEKFNDTLQEMSETINSLKISVAEDLFPTFSEMFKSVGAYVKKHRGELIPLIKEVFTGVAKFAVNLLPKIPVVLDKVLNIVNMLGPKTVVVGVAFMHVLPAITSIVVGLASIAPLVFKIIGGVKLLAGLFWPVVTAVKLTAAVLGGPVLATIGLVVAAVVSWGIAIKSVIDNWNLVPDAIEWIGTTIKESIGFWIDWFGTCFKTIANWFNTALVDPVKNFFVALPGMLSGVWDGFKSGIANIGTFIYDAIYGNITKAFSAAKSILSKIPGLGKLFGGSENPLSIAQSASVGGVGETNTPSAAAAQMISESRVTTTNRFAVDFKNMPRGVTVTPPENGGDFDWSRGYVLGGV